jgi:chlorobactene glucosyltransferase
LFILPILAYLAAVWMVFCAWENIHFIEKVPLADPTQGRWPKVSILIPARNEEKRIKLLLESLVLQDYPLYEILVLDDRSTDKTLELLLGFAKKHKHLKVLRGRELPEGWLGKPWACQQLSQKAKGDWLLFTDADTWHDPDMLKRSVAYAVQKKADALSLINRQETGTWMEMLVVPVMVFSLVAHLPGAWALNPRSPFRRFAGVGGQFILVRRKVYQALGGHGSVRNEIVEDLSFGKELVRKSFRVVLGNGSDFTHCRMYGNAGEVWDGFSKNMFPATRFSLPRMALVILELLGVGAAPFLGLFLGFASPLFLPCLALALSQWGVRLAHAHYFRMSRLSILFHPLGSILFALIGMNSVRWFLSGRGRWKGRSLSCPVRG